MSKENRTMPGRICQICASGKLTKRAAGLIAEGLADQKIADQLGLAGSAGRMVVSRHRRSHVEAPAKKIAEAANKGRAIVEQREQLVAAAEAGDAAAAFIGLSQIATDLRRVQERLERTADAAETDNQRLTVASLSGQQLRAAEVRAKLGGVGGYGAQRAGGQGDGPVLTVNFNFSGGRSQQIDLSSPPTIDAQSTPPLGTLAVSFTGGGHGVVADLPDDADEEN